MQVLGQVDGDQQHHAASLYSTLQMLELQQAWQEHERSRWQIITTALIINGYNSLLQGVGYIGCQLSDHCDFCTSQVAICWAILPILS